MPTDLQQAASDYVAAGLHILALTGKRPNGRVHGESWSYDASWHGVAETQAELDALDRAFSPEVGTTGIAILIPPGMLVADIDTEAAAELHEEMCGEATDETIGARTKNGVHIWYVSPGASRNFWLKKTLLFKGLGGYVVAPPSLHFDADGKQDGTYEWGAHPLVVGGTLYQPEILPEKVRELVKLHDQFAEMKPDREATAGFEVKAVEGQPWWLWPKEWTYNTAGLEAAIENAADGNQNNVIHWAAMTARDEGVPLRVSMERLLAAAERGKHPRSRAVDTINGVYKRSSRG
jgi:hypothetical protein